MSILRFRIIFEDYDDVYRDIDFTAENTFADLFNELLTAVGFDNKHVGEFFLADHNWRKGDSIGSLSGADQKTLSKVDLVEHIDDPHQKFMFLYDQDAKWSFTIELIRVIASPEHKVVYPRIFSKSGVPPIQYKESLIIPTKEKPAEDGRGRRKAKPEGDDELLAMLGKLALDDSEEESAAEEDEEAIEGAEIELEEEDLETDNEIAKLAEEFNNTTEVGDNEDSSGYGDDDDEFGSDMEEDEDYGRGGGSDYDE
jgi:hypothetical protein